MKRHMYYKMANKSLHRIIYSTALRKTSELKR